MNFRFVKRETIFYYLRCYGWNDLYREIKSAWKYTHSFQFGIDPVFQGCPSPTHAIWWFGGGRQSVHHSRPWRRFGKRPRKDPLHRSFAWRLPKLPALPGLATITNFGRLWRRPSNKWSDAWQCPYSFSVVLGLRSEDPWRVLCEPKNFLDPRPRRKRNVASWMRGHWFAFQANFQAKMGR